MILQQKGETQWEKPPFACKKPHVQSLASQAGKDPGLKPGEQLNHSVDNTEIYGETIQFGVG